MLTSLARTVPFVWPYRRRILLSVLFALVVGLLWGANLSIAFPLVKVLLEKKSLDQYSREAIAELERRKAKLQPGIAERNRTLEETEGNKARYRVQRDITPDVAKLSTIENKLLMHRWARKHVLRHFSEDRFHAFAAIMGVLLIATVFKGICVFAQEFLVGSTVQLGVMGIRKRLFRKTLALDYQTLAGEGTAELTARFTYDMDVLASGLYLLGGKVVREPIKAVVCLGGALWLNWRLTVLSFIIAPLAGVVFYRFGRTLKKASHHSIESMARMYKVIGETFESTKIVLAFNGARAQRRRFHHENKTFFHKTMKLVKVDALTSPTTELLGLLAISLGLFPAVYLLMSGKKSIWGIQLTDGPMGVAELGLFYTLLVGVSDPLRKMSSVYAKLKRASAAAERIFAFMDRQSIVLETRQPKPFVRHQESVEFCDIDFSYQAQDGHIPRPALQSVNFYVSAGETIAIVGANGSGKSTLVNMLPRFFDPSRGAVQIDGVDIRDLRLKNLRSQIGLVTQETILFDESIFENIRYGKQSAGHHDVEQAARAAHVPDFLRHLPDGLETRVGEKGCRLSGGQRQRIALARAILHDPSILILDEATSAIDSRSELLIHETLEEFSRDRTTFIITHSLGRSMLNLVDRIAVMDQGHLVGIGTHEELLESCDVYRKLQQVQARQHSSAVGGVPSHPSEEEASGAPVTRPLHPKRLRLVTDHGERSGESRRKGTG